MKDDARREAAIEEVKEQIKELLQYVKEAAEEKKKILDKIQNCTPEEEMIMEKIRHALEEHKLKYTFDEDEPKHLRLRFQLQGQSFSMDIILQDTQIIFWLNFPFKVQTNAFPLMCLFMAEFNDKKPFAHLSLDPEDGEVTMQYSYILEDPAQFSERHFLAHLMSVIYPAREIYTDVLRLTVGIVSHKKKEQYKKLLTMALETLNGEFDDDHVGYGITDMDEEPEPKWRTDLADLMPFDDDDDDDEDEDDDEADIYEDDEDSGEDDDYEDDEEDDDNDEDEDSEDEEDDEDEDSEDKDDDENDDSEDEDDDENDDSEDEDGDDSDEDEDPDTEIRSMEPGFLRRIRENRPFSLDDFMRISMEMRQGKAEEESEIPFGGHKDVLSMFARKNSGKKTEAEGGDEDE